MPGRNDDINNQRDILDEYSPDMQVMGDLVAYQRYVDGKKKIDIASINEIEDYRLRRRLKDEKAFQEAQKQGAEAVNKFLLDRNEQTFRAITERAKNSAKWMDAEERAERAKRLKESYKEAATYFGAGDPDLNKSLTDNLDALAKEANIALKIRDAKAKQGESTTLASLATSSNGIAQSFFESKNNKYLQDNLGKLSELEANIRNRQDMLDSGELHGAAKTSVEKALEKDYEALKEINDTNKKNGKKLDAIKELQSMGSKSIMDALNLLSQNIPAINTRLQGTEKNWASISKIITRNLSVNPFVSSKDVLQKMTELSNTGIAYNLELRAFLGTVKDSVATTFDVANSSLLRIVRLQQSDSSAARLGMEANLTKYLNSMFETTEYLGSSGGGGVFDQVESAILEASSQLSLAESAEFEYAVQKWLGSLYSVGLGENTISRLAQGINYLGTGNYGALAKDNSLQTLFAMASERAGLSYSDILQQGLDASTVNKLMSQVVTYLGEISQDTNKVVKSAWGNIFDMSLADFKALGNLASSVGAVSGQNLSYSGMTSELNSQLGIGTQMGRSSMVSMVNTLVDNFLFGAGNTIANDPIASTTYILLDALTKGDNSQGTMIPMISVMGNTFDLNNSIEGVVKTLLEVGYGVAGIANLIGAISSGAGFSLDNIGAWGAKSSVSRGGGIQIGKQGFTVTESSTQLVGNASQSDIEQNTILSQKEKAEQTQEITGTKPNHDFDEFYSEVIEGQSSINVKGTNTDNSIMTMIEAQQLQGIKDHKYNVNLDINEKITESLTNIIINALQNSGTLKVSDGMVSSLLEGVVTTDSNNKNSFRVSIPASSLNAISEKVGNYNLQQIVTHLNNMGSVLMG